MRNLFRRSGSGRKACGGHRTYLQMERLDDRTVPSTFTVTNLADSGTGSLRQAILDANSPANPEADVIDFKLGLTGTINLASVLPDLSTNIDIQGPGANLLTVNRGTPNAPGYYFRIFTVGSGAKVALSGLTITNGNSLGGGIYNDGTLTLNNVSVDRNFPGGQWAGGIANNGTLMLNNSTVSNNVQGGIYNDGTLTLNNSTVSGNWAAWAGGGIGNSGTLTLNNSTVSGNTADAGGEGGGIWNTDTGTLTLNNSTVSGNTAVPDEGWGGGVGGGIFNSGTATLNNTIVANSPSGGDVFNTGTLTGSHNLIEDGSTAGLLADTLTGDPLLYPLQDNGGPTFTHALKSSSPAIDAGDNAGAPLYDQRGEGYPRIVGGTIDIGAFEVQAANPPPVLNDAGFEAPAVGAGSFNSFQYAPTGTPWTYAGNAGVAGNGSGFTSGNLNAPEGTQVGFLQRTGSFSQQVTVQAAGTYQLSFQAAQRANYQASKQDFKVLVDGQVVGTFTPTGTTYATYKTPAFSVAAGMHTIRFVGLDSAGGDNTAFLDAVTLAQVSIPSMANAGFEAPAVGAGSFNSFQYRPTDAGWSFSGGAGISGNGSGFTAGNLNAPEGTQVGFLQRTGSFSQQVTVQAAGSYQLTFFAAQRLNWQASRQDFEVLIDGVVVGTFTPAGGSYARYATSAFSVTAGSHTITFRGLDSAGGDNTAFLDDARISPA